MSPHGDGMGARSEDHAAYALHHQGLRPARGVTAGTPFITHGREFWPHSEAGYDLDQAVTAYQRIGRLRIAQEDDLAACRPFDGLPSQDRPSGERRAAL
jgi:hypothetical protein